MLIVSAGMPGTGSTWLYNVLRYAFINARMRTYGCYADLYDPRVEAQVHVVKVHSYGEELGRDADFVFTMTRDLCEVAASYVRRGMVEFEPCAVIDRLNQNLADHDRWSAHSCLETDYRTMKTCPIRSVRAIINKLGLGPMVNSRVVVEDVAKLSLCVSPVVDQTTQLWPNHLSDGTFELTQPIVAAIRELQARRCEHYELAR